MSRMKMPVISKRQLLMCLFFVRFSNALFYQKARALSTGIQKHLALRNFDRKSCNMDKGWNFVFPGQTYSLRQPC